MYKSYSKLATMIYGLLVNCNKQTIFGRIIRNLLQRLRMIMITYNDPKCIMDVHGKLLAMPLSHSLPLFVAENPYYDSIIERISSYIRATYGTLNYIDIGANIGDTILFTNPKVMIDFLP